MKTLSSFAFAALLAGCSSPGPSATPPGQLPPPPPALATLDNTTWSLHVEPMDGGGKAYDDDLKFADRHAALRVWEGRGYAANSFSATPKEKDGAVAFEFQVRTKEGETLNVSGCANGIAIWGTLTWRKADWTLSTYRYRGKPKT